MSAYSIATRGLAGRKVPQGVLATMDELLFSGSEQGAWYDPSDMSTLFQDTAGTVPVTAVEQAVALMLDKSGRGNHAIQATSTKRPVLSARVNLLTKTRGAFLANYTTTDNVIPPPTGVSTSTQIVATATPSLPIMTSTATSTSIVASCYFHTTGTETIRTLLLRNYTTSNNLAVVAVNLTTGAKTDGGVNSTVTYAGGGWYKLQISQSTGISVGDTLYLYIGRAAVEATGVTWNIAGPSLVPAGRETLPHQWSDSSSSYDTAGFPYYLRFDGIDDGMQTGNIDFTGTDKMTVIAGVTASTTSVGIVCELTTNAGGIPGSMYLDINDVAGYSASAFRGATTATILRIPQAPLEAPCILSATGDLSVPTGTIRKDGSGSGGTMVAGSTRAGFVNAPIYLGARANTSLFFRGNLYSLIIRGAQSSLSQIEATELHIRRRMMLP